MDETFRPHPETTKDPVGSRSPLRRGLAPLLVSSAALLLTFTPTLTEASPPQDDWSIETKADDDILVEQRFGKLRAAPFDNRQWRALAKAIGARGLAAKIEAAARRNPNDAGLQILMARVEMDGGKPRAAAERLAPIVETSNRWSTRAFELRVRALVDANLEGEAIQALEARAADESGEARNDRLVEAYEIASRAGEDEKAMELAETLARAKPDDGDAQVRLARAATEADDAAVADRAWARAAELARGSRRDEWVAERARARAGARNLDGADELLWSLVENPKHGTRDARQRWWEMLVEVHRQGASGEVLARRVEAWLARPGHGGDTGAYRALAGARTAAGQDPIEAWRQVVELDPRDTEARASLIHALESEGRSEAAVDEFKALSGRSTQEVQLGLEMARRLITNGAREQGLALAGELEKSGSRSAHTLLMLLDFYNTEGEHQTALRVAERLVKLAPRDADARIALGEQLFEMGQRDEALEQWSRLPKLVRPAHEGFARYAEVLSAHARSDRRLAAMANEAVMKALKARPDSPEYLRLSAVLKSERQSGRSIELIDAWQAVRVAAVGDANALLREEARTRLVELLQPSIYDHCKGPCQTRRDLLVRSAREDLRGEDKAASLEGGLFLAAIASAEQDYVSAASVHAELVRRDPENVDRYLELARAELRARKEREAVETLETALEETSKREGDVLALLSEVALAAGDDEAAERAALRAAALGPDGAEALLNLGDAYRRRGALDAAERAYRATLEASPQNARARTELADLQLTRGDLSAAAATYRELLEAGGNPEAPRDAGTRALDLAEASGSLDELLDLAVRRTKQTPNSEEPREFLLDALERVGSKGVVAWLGANADGDRGRDEARVAALRRALIGALNRGPVRMRLRAAEQLGELRLPDTAEPLARLGARLSPPRDATNAIRDAFIAVRIRALVAAGSLEDPRALDTLIEVLKHEGFATREAAAWAIAQSDDERAVGALREHLTLMTSNESSTALACLGVALHSSPSRHEEDLLLVRARASEMRELGPKRACLVAAASLMGAGRLDDLKLTLREADPDIAEIAAWRLRSLRGDEASILTELLVAYLGPPGRLRDAAASALAYRLESTGPAAAFVLPEPPESRAQWSSTLNRWVDAQVSSTRTDFDGRRLEGHVGVIGKALEVLDAGTRAQREAAKRARRGCQGDGVELGGVCLPAKGRSGAGAN